MVDERTGVLEALRQLGIRGGEPVTVEELVEITGLSEKWVRESLLRLELQGRVTARDPLPGESSRGTRLYSLGPVEEPSRTFQTDFDNRSQTLLAKPRLTETSRQAVEIGTRKRTFRDWPLPPPIPIIKELIRRRAEIRDVLLKTTIPELEDVFNYLQAEKGQEGRTAKRLGANPFLAVSMSAWKGLIDDKARKISLNKALIIGTASSAESRLLGLRFGSYRIPVKFGLTTACGIIHQYDTDGIKTHEIKRPKRLAPDSVTEDFDQGEFPGMNKILKETFHYDLDIETLEFALDIRRQRLHYKTDIESVEHAESLRSAGSPLLLLKSGSLTPQEQSPFDLVDPRKAVHVLRAFSGYNRLRDRMMDLGSNSLPMGMIRNSESRRSIFRDLIDELLRRRLSEWEPGKLNLLNDNAVLGILLDPGEITAVVKKTPHEDVLQAQNPERVRGIIGASLFNQWDADRKKAKTYQFFMGFGDNNALRFDYPVYREVGSEGPELRDKAKNVIFTLCSPLGEFEGTIPRIVSYAEDFSKKHIDSMGKLVPSWIGGISR